MIDLDYLWLDLLVLIPVLEDDMTEEKVKRCTCCDEPLDAEALAMDDDICPDCWEEIEDTINEEDDSEGTL